MTVRNAGSGTPGTDASPTDLFRSARDFLLAHREDYRTARARFRWPRLDEFNWALDWFDTIGTRTDRPALWIASQDGPDVVRTFAELTRRSDQVANWLREIGVARGDRLMVMLGNQVELWETILAVMKLGAVVIPATPMLGPADLRDRVGRGAARHVVAAAEDAAKFGEVPGDYTRIAVGDRVEGWHQFSASEASPTEYVPDGVTRGEDTLLLYFTSGTTALPKMVEHTHVSYPVGHLSTMYWIGLQPGDLHLNLSSPGWAKHAWSNLFAPWNAEATVVVYSADRFDPDGLLRAMQRCGVTSFCAPPTVWRMLIQSDLRSLPNPPRNVVGAGEPLNPEIIEQVRLAWSVTIRDGFGQTETSVQVGNTPGQRLVPGSMGRPLPGFEVDLLDVRSGEPAVEGEICLRLDPRPVGVMVGYADDAEHTSEVMRDGYFHTGDVGIRDAAGYIRFVGRTDDVFKASDYRISPFELESVLLEHPAVAEAAVVPSPDPLRLAVPKAYVALGGDYRPGRQVALSILRFARDNLAPYKRIRRLEFMELPKTISGKIKRVDLRTREREIHQGGGTQLATEYRDDDVPEWTG